MSWEATAFVNGIRADISRSEKLLLLVIANYHNKGWKAAWPSLTMLSEDALLSRRQVIRLIACLREKGLLSVVPEGQRGTNIYRFVGLDLHSTSDMMSPVVSGCTSDTMMSPVGVGPTSDMLGSTSDTMMSPVKKTPTSDILNTTSDILGPTSDIAMSPNPTIDPTTDPTLHETVPSEEPKSSAKKPSLVEPWYGMFQEAFSEVSEDELPYEGKKKDFIQLRELLKQPKVAAWMTPERWRHALENYFLSEIGTHTLADFCVRFATFYKHALDRYQKPIVGTEAPRKPKVDADDGREARKRRERVEEDPERVSFEEAKKRWGIDIKKPRAKPETELQ